MRLIILIWPRRRAGEVWSLPRPKQSSPALRWTRRWSRSRESEIPRRPTAVHYIFTTRPLAGRWTLVHITRIRDACGYQNGWIFRKIPKGGGGTVHWIQDNFIWDILCNIWWIKLGFFDSKCEKSGSLKWENCQKQPILGMFWCFWVTKSVSPQLRPGSKVVFFTIFADYDGWEAEKSRNSAQ